MDLIVFPDGRIEQDEPYIKPEVEDEIQKLLDAISELPETFEHAQKIKDAMARVRELLFNNIDGLEELDETETGFYEEHE